MSEERLNKNSARLDDHEARLFKMEPIVESLHYHHRHDDVLSQISSIRAELSSIKADVENIKTKAKNGNGADSLMDKRVRWVERIAFGSIGAISALAAVEWLKRLFK